MNKVKMKELRQKENKELDLDLAGLKKELFDLSFQSSTETLSNPSRISQIRKEMARIRTLLRERELEAAAASGNEPSTKSDLQA